MVPPLKKTEKLQSTRMTALIKAAEDVFLVKGYYTATMSDVAKAAGMSKKTVYQIVESKAELFGALLTHQHAMLQFPEPQEGATIRDILVQNLLCLAELLLSPKQIAILRLIMAEYTHSPDLARIFHQKRVTKAKNRLENCLQALSPFKPVKAAELREMSAMLFGMTLGEFHLGLLIGFRQMPAKAVLERRICRAVDLFLSGYPAIKI